MAEAPAIVEIPHFPEGKRLAVTTSWDDGTVHDRRLVLAANAKTAQNPGARAVWLKADGRLMEVPGGSTVPLAR